VSQLKDSALHSNVLLPIEAVCGTTSHGTEQKVVDFDNFAHIVTGDESSLSGSGVNTDHYSVLKLEGYRCSSLGEVSDLVSG